ncbi:MAG TPA: VOC family protein, partial [Thermoanaerobaculia bacterium]
VAAIEPVLAFWIALGFKVEVEVPHGDRLGFVILKSGDVELMYQTVDSVREDEGKVLEGSRAIGANALFLEVDNLDAVRSKLPKGTDVIVRERKTFYGATETIVRDPAGNVITLAQMAEQK